MPIMKTHPSTSNTKNKAITQGETLPVMSDGSAPKLPHERDESSSSQQSEPREVIEQASKDLAAGIVDGDMGPPMDDTYFREFREGDDASGCGDTLPSTKKRKPAARTSRKP
jgi:hypothetical protein